MDSIKIGIIGATSYTARELIIILYKHPDVELCWITSESETGQRLQNIYPLFLGKQFKDLVFQNYQNIKNTSPDIVFSCLPHGISALFLLPFLENVKTKVIDLSADFRMSNLKSYETYYNTKHPCPQFLTKSQFGLAEWNFSQIKKSTCVGNPGCYPTSILLPLLPLLKEKKILTKNIVIDSKSGISGAGRSLSKKTHYSECNESFLAYNIADQHRHISEITEQLNQVSFSKVEFLFTPHLVPMERGILSTIYVDLSLGVTQQDILDTYDKFYNKSFFVFVVDHLPTTRDVKSTNNCLIYFYIVKSQPQKMVIISVIDNLIKGASGQAVQNMNLMMGLSPSKGLI